MNNALSVSVMQIATQSPALLVYLAGVVVAMMYWSRYPRPAMCVFLASMMMLLLLTIGLPVLQNIVILNRAQQGDQQQRLQAMFTAIAVLSALVRAVATGLMIAAAFVDRSQPFDPMMPEE